jgi:hypothetical protein
MKDHYDESYKAGKEEIETIRWKALPCLWIDRINNVKTIILPKAIYKFNAVPTKILKVKIHMET